MNDIQRFLNKILSDDGVITFKVSHENSMREIESSYNGEHSKEINNWLGYGGLYDALDNEYYDYHGKITINGNAIEAQIRFEGPFEDEFENVQIKINEDEFTKLFSNELEKLSIVNYNPEAFYLSFDYSYSDGFSGFTANYYTESNKLIELQNIMSPDQIIQLQNYCKTRIYSNIPRLNIVQNVNQHWIATCEENKMQFSIFTDYITISNFDFSI